MNEAGTITLTKEKETLFITLYAKALDYRSPRSILNDKAAYDLVNRSGLDLTKYNGFGNAATVVRARQMDVWMQEFIKQYPDATVVYLGCGLDTRITRIDPPATVSWYDVDYPEVIALRKTFYPESGQYKMIASSVTDAAWLAQIPTRSPVLIIAEGVFEYLTKEEVGTLVTRLTTHFSHGEILFDVMNSFAIRSGKDKLRETTGAVHKWAVDDVAEVDQLNPAWKRMENLPLFRSPFIRQLPLGLRIFLNTASLFPAFRNMIRLLRYRF